MLRLSALIIAAALVLPIGAAAQTDFTADEIVDHFKPKGAKTRGVTFDSDGFGDKKEGDASADASPAVEQPDAFNLSVTFEFNSDRLTGQAQRNLRQFAEALTRPELSGLRFAVDGHTDASGTESYNQDLSERRAQSVVNFLTRQGIDPLRLEPRGYGERRPATENKRDAANRRVETRLLD